MKKMLSMMLALLMMLSASAALANNMSVQIIGGPEMEAQSVSLDDVKIGSMVEIENYAQITPTHFSFADILYVYEEGSRMYVETYQSGAEAQYALLRMDCLNCTITSRDYLASCEVKAVYDDVFEYKGWVYQHNWDYKAGNLTTPEEAPVNPADVFAIEPMYNGHYTFGCTLPNAVVEGKAPLKLIITMDGNEITYNIRK